MDDLIDDGGTTVIDDGEDYEEIIEDEWGIRTEIVRAMFAADAGVTEKDRSYTEVDAGVFKFGYRNADSLTKHQKYTLSQTTYQSGSSTYYGIACNAERIKIAPDLRLTKDNLSRGQGFMVGWGSYTPFNGYFSVVTNVIEDQNSGLEWTVEDLPFRNGLCVARR